MFTAFWFQNCWSENPEQCSKSFSSKQEAINFLRNMDTNYASNNIIISGCLDEINNIFYALDPNYCREDFEYTLTKYPNLKIMIVGNDTEVEFKP